MDEQIFEKLAKIMEEQIELIKRYCDSEKQLRECLFEKDWKSLEETITTLQPLTDRVNELETERNSLFEQLREDLGEEKTASFYQVIIHLPEEERDALAALYRELKMAVFHMQGITNSIDVYINSMSETMNYVLDELLPHRKGKIYARDGKPTQKDANPLVISHHS
jgi:predicted transcriptional regulator